MSRLKEALPFSRGKRVGPHQNRNYYTTVMGTRDGAWTGIRYYRSSFLFWVKLAIGIVRAIGIIRIAWDRVS